MATGSLGTISIDLEAKLAKFESDIGRAARLMEREMSRSARATARAVDQMRAQLERQAKAMEGTFRGVAKSIAGVLSLRLLADFGRGIARMNDGFINVQSQLRQTTNSQRDLARATQLTFQVAQRTYASFESTGLLVGRTARALQSAGRDQNEALSQSLRFSEAINNAFVLSGAKAIEAKNAILQLSQGLASGTLRGDEYRSVAEQGSKVTEILAKNLTEVNGQLQIADGRLGITTGRLRELAYEGKLTTDLVVGAMSAGFDELSRDVQKIPLTVERAFLQLENAAENYVGNSKSVSGTASALAQTTSNLATNFTAVADSMLVVGAAAAVLLSARGLGGLAGFLEKSTAAFLAKRTAMQATAQAAVMSAQATQVQAASELASAAATQKRAEVDLVALRAAIAKTEQAKIYVRSMIAEQQALAAATKTGHAYAQHMRAVKIMKGELLTLAKLHAKANWELAASERAVAIASGGTALAGGVYRKSVLDTKDATEKLAKSTNSAKNAIKAAGAGLVSFLGGPVGTGIIVIGALAYALYELDAAFETGSEKREKISADLEAINEKLREQRRLILDQIKFNASPEDAPNLATYDQQKESVAQLKAELDNLITAYNQLRPSISELDGEQDQLRIQIIATTQELNTANAVLAEADRQGSGLSETLRNDVNTAFITVSQAINDLAAVANAADLSNLFLGWVQSANQMAASFDNMSKKGRTYIDGLKEQAATYGMAASEALLYEAAIKAAAEKDAEAAAEIMDVANALAAKMRVTEQASAATKAAKEETKRATKEYQSWAQRVRDGHAAIKESLGMTEDEAKAKTDLSKRFKDTAKGLANEIRLLGLHGDAREKFAIRLDAESMALDEHGEVVKEAADQYEKLLTQLAKMDKVESILEDLRAEDGMDGLAAQIERIGEALKTALDIGPPTEEMLANIDELQQRMTQLRIKGFESIGGSVLTVVDSMKSMAEEGTKEYKQLEAASMALNIALGIAAILTQGKGDPYTAFARMAAMAAMVAQYVGGLGGAGGGGGSAQSRQQTQGTGSVLGDAEADSESIARGVEITADATSALVGINMNMLSALRSLQTSLGGAAAGVARTDFANIELDQGAFSSLGLNPIGSLSLGAQVLDSLFGGEQELIDQGILIVGGTLQSMIDNIMASTYQTIETDGGWFGSDDIDDELQPLSDAATQQLRLVLESLGDAVRAGAEALGLDMEQINAAIDAFHIEEIRISTMDLSAEDAQAELEAVFSQIFDGLAGSVVPFISQFQRVGEGLGETLIRVATGVQVTQEAVMRLGFALDETDPERFAQISEGLIEMVGGLDEFISSMANFMDNFAPESHQLAILLSDMTRAFDQVGLAVPATREAMWALIQSLDATTDSEQIAALLRLADVSHEYYTVLERDAERAATALEQMREALMDYTNAVLDIESQIAEMDLSEFQMELRQIAINFSQNTTNLNALARAAGLSAAREEDLARAHTLAAMQAARAIAALEARGRDLVAQLGYGRLGQVEAAIAAIENAPSAVEEFGDAVTEVTETLRDQIDLLLGDLSPLKDAQKLPLALQALEQGRIGPEDVLRIGRRLFASGQDYNNLFDQVLAIGDRRQNGSTTPPSAGPSTPGIDPALAALQAERDALLEEQRQQERFLQAMDLSQIIADLAGAREISFEEAAQLLGISDLTDVAEDLRLDGLEPLIDYLTSLQADSYAFEEIAFSIDAGSQAIVDALYDIFNFTRGEGAVAFDKPLLVPEPWTKPVTVPPTTPPINPDDGGLPIGGDGGGDDEDSIRDGIIEIGDMILGRLQLISDHTGATAAGMGTIAESAESSRLAEIVDRPRTFRNPLLSRMK